MNRKHYIVAAVIAAALGAVAITASGVAAGANSPQARKTNPPILDNFVFACNDSNANGLASMHDGVIKVCIPLVNSGFGFFGRKYDEWGFPVKVTLFLPAGATFSAKVKIYGWNHQYPKKTKATKKDKTWHWVKVGGVMRPRLFVRHFLPVTFVTSLVTIKLSGSPLPSSAVVVMKAKFPHVPGAQMQLACQTFWDSSSGTPEPQNQCHY